MKHVIVSIVVGIVAFSVGAFSAKMECDARIERCNAERKYEEKVSEWKRTNEHAYRLAVYQAEQKRSKEEERKQEEWNKLMENFKVLNEILDDDNEEHLNRGVKVLSRKK